MLLGWLRRSATCFGGYLWYKFCEETNGFVLISSRKTPYKLNSLRKRSVRNRLKNVEGIIGLINSTGIKFKALVKHLNNTIIFIDYPSG